MTFLDVGVQVFALAASNGLDEVLPVAAAFTTRRPWLLLLAQEGLVRVVILDRHVTFRAIENIADAVSAGDQPTRIASLSNTRFVVGHPVTHFKNDHYLLAVLIEFEVG